MKDLTGEIKKILAKRDSKVLMRERQNRLVALVDRYGYDNVSCASGWSVSTILQYCQSKSPIIGLEKLDIAEEVLKQL